MTTHEHFKPWYIEITVTSSDIILRLYTRTTNHESAPYESISSRSIPLHRSDLRIGIEQAVEGLKTLATRREEAFKIAQEAISR